MEVIETPYVKNDPTRPLLQHAVAYGFIVWNWDTARWDNIKDGVWVVLKIVEGKVTLVVGPFPTEMKAGIYSNQAIIGSLGYEKWEVHEVERPNF